MAITSPGPEEKHRLTSHNHHHHHPARDHEPIRTHVRTRRTDTLHGAADLGGDPEELAEVPARNLHHAVVQAGLKVGRGGVGDRVPAGDTRPIRRFNHGGRNEEEEEEQAEEKVKEWEVQEVEEAQVEEEWVEEQEGGEA